MDEKRHDLSDKIIGGKTAILVQPWQTFGMSKESFQQEDEKAYCQVIADTMQLKKLRHVANITLAGRFRDGFVEKTCCGGTLSYRAIPSSKRYDAVRERTPMALICSDCPACLWFRSELLVAKTDMFHLIFKQSLPKHPIAQQSCNFINCKISPGLISLGVDLLEGCISNDELRRGGTYWHSLAFMLMPGMDTINEPDIFPNWNNLLGRRLVHIQNHSTDLLRRMLFGPKRH